MPRSRSCSARRRVSESSTSLQCVKPIGFTRCSRRTSRLAGITARWPRRKARIVLALLKRHGLAREYRGGSWERVQDRLTSVDLSADLTDYEQRRLQDRAKLRAMISYCQSAQCRTRFILEYFGEEIEPDWRCGNCDA